MGPSRSHFAVASVLVATLACSSETKKGGQIMLSVQTNMAIPKDVSDVTIEVLSFGKSEFSKTYAVGSGKLLIPATLGIVGGKDPAAPVTIRVIAKQAGKLRTIREAVTTVPTDRLALLRMPIEWLCDGTAEAKGNVVESTCGKGKTCIGGSCQSSIIAEKLLADYDPKAVFGGSESAAEGACFDTVKCFAGGHGVVPDEGCTIAAPSGGKGTNVALVTNQGADGICGTEACLLPLDGESDSGFRQSGGRLRLPPAVCARLGEGRIAGVAVTTDCETKTAALPTCGPWSSVTSASGSFDERAPVGVARLDDSGVGDAAEASAEPDARSDGAIAVLPDSSAGGAPGSDAAVGGGGTSPFDAGAAGFAGTCSDPQPSTPPPRTPLTATGCLATTESVSGRLEGPFDLDWHDEWGGAEFVTSCSSYSLDVIGHFEGCVYFECPSGTLDGGPGSVSVNCGATAAPAGFGFYNGCCLDTVTSGSGNAKDISIAMDCPDGAVRLLAKGSVGLSCELYGITVSAH